MGSCTTAEAQTGLPHKVSEKQNNVKTQPNSQLSGNLSLVQEKLKIMKLENEKKMEQLERIKQETRKKQKQMKQKRIEEQKKRQKQIEKKLNDLKLKEEKLQERRKKVEENKGILAKNLDYIYEVHKNQAERGRSLQARIYNVQKKIYQKELHYAIGNGLQNMINKKIDNPQKTPQSTQPSQSQVVNYPARKSHIVPVGKKETEKSSGIYTAKKKQDNKSSVQYAKTAGIKKQERRVVQEDNNNPNVEVDNKSVVEKQQKINIIEVDRPKKIDNPKLIIQDNSQNGNLIKMTESEDVEQFITPVISELIEGEQGEQDGQGEQGQLKVPQANNNMGLQGESNLLLESQNHGEGIELGQIQVFMEEPR